MVRLVSQAVVRGFGAVAGNTWQACAQFMGVAGSLESRIHEVPAPDGIFQISRILFVFSLPRTSHYSYTAF